MSENRVRSTQKAQGWHKGWLGGQAAHSSCLRPPLTSHLAGLKQTTKGHSRAWVICSSGQPLSWSPGTAQGN